MSHSPDTDRRRLFRIPLPAQHGLQTTITSGTREWRSVRVINLGLGGMLVDFTSLDRSLRAGDCLQLTLTFEDQSVCLPVEVRHRNGLLCGLRFLSEDRELQQLVQSLQLRWLRERRGSDVQTVAVSVTSEGLVTADRSQPRGL